MSPQKAKKPKESQPSKRAIHITAEAWPPEMVLEGEWSFIDLLATLNYLAEHIRFQGAEKAVENALGYQARLREVLESVREPSEEQGGEDRLR